MTKGLSKRIKLMFACHFLPYTYKTLTNSTDTILLKELVMFLKNQPTTQSVMENHWAVFRNPHVDFSFIEWVVKESTKNYTKKLHTVDYFGVLENPNLTPETLRKLLVLNGSIIGWNEKYSHLLNKDMLSVILEKEDDNSLFFLFGALKEKKLILDNEIATYIMEKVSLKDTYRYLEIFLSTTTSSKVMEIAAERVLSSNLETNQLAWFQSLYLNPNLHFSKQISDAFNKVRTYCSLRSSSSDNTPEKIQVSVKYMLFNQPPDSTNPEIIVGSPSIRWENFDVETLIFAGLHFSDGNNFYIELLKNAAIRKTNSSSWSECLSNYLSEITGDDCSELPNDWVTSLLKELTVA